MQIYFLSNFLILSFFSIGIGVFTFRKFNLRVLQFGFAIFVIFSSLFLFFNRVDGLLIAKIIFIIAAILSFFGFFKYRKEIFRSLDFKYYSILSIIFILIFLITGNEAIRFHMAPDNHGFAATYSYFHENFSYYSLVEEFKNITGLDKAIHLAQQTPNFPSVYSIPDARLRFAAEIFTVGRLGLPASMVVLTSFQNGVLGFETSMIVFGMFGVICLGANLINLSKIIFGRKDFPLFIDITLGLLISVSPIFLIYILEGALNQFFLLYYLTILLISIFEYNQKSNIKSSIPIYLCSLAGIMIYPNGYPLFILLLTLSALAMTNKIFFAHAISVTLVLSACVYLLLGEAFLPMMKSFIISGVSGMPYQLHFNTIPEVLTWNFIDYQITPAHSTSTPFGISSTSIRKPNEVIISNLIFIFINLFIFIKITYKKFLDNKIQRNIFISLILISTLPLLKGINEDVLHRYIYLRNISLISLWIIPILISIIYFIHSKLNKKNISNFLSIVILTITIFTSYEILNTFNRVSRPFFCIDQDLVENLSFESNKTIYISDIPNHSFFAMALLGKFYYITDNWQPMFLPKQFKGKYKLKEINGDICARKIRNIDNVNVTKAIRGPVKTENYKEFFEAIPKN